MADLTAANRFRLCGVTDNTNDKQTRAWTRWTTYLTSIGLGDEPFLCALSPPERLRIICAFAQAIRDARYSPTRFSVLTAGVVKATISDVAATFRTHDRPDPRLDPDGKVAFILQRQLRGYSNTDPGEKPQQALSADVIEKLHAMSLLPDDKIKANLLIVAFFFAMRSCEYSTVSGTRRTKIIRLGGIRFYIGKRLIPHDSPILHRATSGTLLFEYQKNDSRNETVTAHKTYHPTMCPVIQLVILVRRLLAIPGANQHTPINTYLPSGATKPAMIHSSDILTRLRLAVDLIGAATLGYTSAEVGLHSLRSGAAMSMYLQGIPVYVIMLLGRWSSDAFLRYIRRNVQEFSSGVSQKMIACPLFFTVPTANIEDPRAPNHRLNHSMRQNCGRTAEAAPTAGTRIALWA